MKIQTMYTCELCGTNYSDKSMAEQCEKTHKTGLKIVWSKYLPRDKSNAKGFPEWVILQAEDGEEVKYRR